MANAFGIEPKPHKCDISNAHWSCPCTAKGPCMDRNGNDLLWLICSEPGCTTVFKR